MPTDFSPPVFDLPPMPDWLGTLTDIDLPLPDLPFDPPVPAGFGTPPPALTPPPRGALVPMAADADRATVRRELPIRYVRRTDSAACWQLTVAPAAPGWDDVRVRFVIPVGLPAARITHKPKVTQREVVWELGRLNAGAVVPLQIRFPHGSNRPARDVSPPLFELTYTPRPVARLDVTADVPSLIRAGATAEASVTVSNVGAAAATKLRVAVMLGDRVVAERALTEELPAGGTAALAFKLVAPEPGPARWFVRCEAEHVEAVTATADAVVFAPFLVSVPVPDKLDLDAVHAFEVRVENPSAVARTGGVVEFRLPAELRHMQSDGTFDPATGRVTWPAGAWTPHQSRTFTVLARGHLPGAFTVAAEVTTAEETVTATASGSCEMVRSQASRDLADWLREQAAADLDDQRTAAPAAAVGERHVVYRLGEQTFASPIAQLREVVRLPAVTPVPGTPDWLLGVANIRGDVLSVVDFPAAVGLTGGATGKRSVLVAGTSDGRVTVALTVDEVVGIHRFAPRPWSADDTLDAGEVGDYLSGLCELRDRLVPVMDLDRLLTSDLLAAGEA